MMYDMLKYPGTFMLPYFIKVHWSVNKKYIPSLLKGMYIGSYPEKATNALLELSLLSYWKWHQPYMEEKIKKCIIDHFACYGINVKDIVMADEYLNGVDFDIINHEGDNELPKLVVYEE